ncbi:MAG: hypothetical protein HAW62_00180 [Endozoicomonadaceae bacterium]|nr:hypothetical protein [Endozoicomonadaceae bacterium]
MEAIFNSTITIALNSGFINKKECEDVIVDTTVIEKNISYPTDSKLYNALLAD